MVLKAQHLGKRFPGVIALNDVSLDVEAGQVMALVGANGAGKSTLIKILTGYYNTYDGAIEIDGKTVQLKRPSDASKHGIQAVYQEVDTVLVPDLTVAENLLINETVQNRRHIFMNWRNINRRAATFLEDLDLQIDVEKRVDNLVLHQKQMLVIARAVHQKVKYLIFDEPTTSLSLREVAQLFDVIRSLADHGVGIIYISHRLGEIQEIADVITVLRGGEKVAEMPVTDFDVGRISEAMLGSPVTELYPPKTNTVTDQPMLEVRNLHVRHTLQDISFHVNKGEILGIAGLVGAGKTELVRAVFAADHIDRGEIYLDGDKVRTKTPNGAVNKGIYLVPEERRSQGILVEDPIHRNMSLPFLRQFSWLFGMMRKTKEMNHAHTIIRNVGVTPAQPEKLVKNLSGGNQQKVAIGKWFAETPKVMIFDEATQGIDVRAKRDVYDLVQNLCTQSAVIFCSSDIDEVIGVANRIIVLKDGRIVAELMHDEFDRTTILEYATGTRHAAADRSTPTEAANLDTVDKTPRHEQIEQGVQG